MPIYEYKCKKCAYRFEKLIFEKEATICPKCKSKKVEKLISVPYIGKNSKSNSEDCSGEICNRCTK